MSSLSWLNLYGEPRIVQRLHKYMQEQINQLQQQIVDLQNELNLMKSAGSYPYDMEQALRDRLDIDSLKNNPSAKDVSTETQSVDEGGTATYDVAKPMDGFEEKFVNGEIRYYPYYL